MTESRDNSVFEKAEDEVVNQENAETYQGYDETAWEDRPSQQPENVDFGEFFGTASTSTSDVDVSINWDPIGLETPSQQGPDFTDDSVSERKEAVQQAPREYIRQGFQPIPVAKGKKSPFVESWPTLEMAEDDVPKHFSDENGYNIGVLLGKAPMYLVDIDLDCDEAKELAKQLCCLNRNRSIARFSK